MVTFLTKQLQMGRELNATTRHSQLQQMYRGFKFEIIPIRTGALGSISNGIKANLQRLGIQKAKTTSLRDGIQKAGLLGTVKICKTILNMENLGRTFKTSTIKKR